MGLIAYQYFYNNLIKLDDTCMYNDACINILSII